MCKNTLLSFKDLMFSKSFLICGCMRSGRLELARISNRSSFEIKQNLGNTRLLVSRYCSSARCNPSNLSWSLFRTSSKPANGIAGTGEQKKKCKCFQWNRFTLFYSTRTRRLAARTFFFFLLLFFFFIQHQKPTDDLYVSIYINIRYCSSLSNFNLNF